MTKEDIKRMAIEAGWDAHQSDFDTRIKAFAKLVAQHEREACANWLEDVVDAPNWAEAIRARGQA